MRGGGEFTPAFTHATCTAANKKKPEFDKSTCLPANAFLYLLLLDKKLTDDFCLDRSPLESQFTSSLHFFVGSPVGAPAS